MRFEMKGVAKVNKRLSNGTIKTYYYAWRGGPQIKAEPGTDEFLAQYLEHKRSRFAPDGKTVASLVFDYEKSHAFEKLAYLTKRDHYRMFKLIRREFGNMPIDALKEPDCRKLFKEWRDNIESANEADKAWATLKRVFSIAMDNGILAWNPCAGGGKRYKGSRAEKIWTQEQIAIFARTAPFHVFLPLMVALHTGQRQGDILRLQWSNYDGQRIRLRQRKTKRLVSVLVSSELKAIIDNLPKDSTYMLLNSRKCPWTSMGFSASFRKAQANAGITGVTFHDSRGTFITNRRGEGSTLEDIADVVGLSTRDVSKVLEKHYLAHDETRSDAVILRMKTANCKPV